MKTKAKPGTSRKSAANRSLAFVHEYLRNGHNGTQAAIAVGYSKRSAGFYACELLKDPKIQEIVETAAKKAADANGLTVEKTVREMCRIAFNDPRKMFDEDNRLKDIHSLDDDTAAGISSVEVFEEFAGKGENRVSIGFTKKIKLHSKTQALDMLAKHQALYAAEKIELSGKITQEQIDAKAIANITSALKNVKRGAK